MYNAKPVSVAFEEQTDGSVVWKVLRYGKVWKSGAQKGMEKAQKASLEAAGKAVLEFSEKYAKKKQTLEPLKYLQRAHPHAVAGALYVVANHPEMGAEMRARHALKYAQKMWECDPNPFKKPVERGHAGRGRAPLSPEAVVQKVFAVADAMEWWGQAKAVRAYIRNAGRSYFGSWALLEEMTKGEEFEAKLMQTVWEAQNKAQQKESA